MPTCRYTAGEVVAVPDGVGLAQAYIVLLAVCAYGVGLPELGGTRRGVVLAAVGSTMVAAGGMSLLQLLAGSALLPSSNGSR